MVTDPPYGVSYASATRYPADLDAGSWRPRIGLLVAELGTRRGLCDWLCFCLGGRRRDLLRDLLGGRDFLRAAVAVPADLKPAARVPLNAVINARRGAGRDCLLGRALRVG